METMFDSPFVVPVVLFASIAAVMILRGPVGRALAERIARRPGRDADAREPLLAEVEDLQRRVGEMEERLDFAERLLARHRDAERLPPG